MELQQSFSHGLLYSVSPENFSELHLHDESDVGDLYWDEHEPQSAHSSFAQVVISLLESFAAKFGIVRL